MGACLEAAVEVVPISDYRYHGHQPMTESQGKMKASIRWVEEAMFIAESESGHVVAIDGPPSAGGRNVGVRPMEMVLMGMGGCTSFDVMSMLRKSRQDVTDCVAKLES